MKKIIFFQSVNVPWLIKLHMMGKVDICGTEFRLGQKPNVSLSVQFLTCVSNKANFFFRMFFFFQAQCAGSPRALYSATKLSERRLSFLQSCGRTHKSRHPSFVTPLSPSSWHDPTLGFAAERHTPSPPIGHQTASAIDGCDVPSLSACMLHSLRGKG